MFGGKCPKCEQLISRANAENLDIASTNGKTYVGVSIVCSSCKTILGASIDPIAIKAEIINELSKILKK